MANKVVAMHRCLREFQSLPWKDLDRRAKDGGAQLARLSSRFCAENAGASGYHDTGRYLGGCSQSGDCIEAKRLVQVGWVGDAARFLPVTILRFSRLSVLSVSHIPYPCRFNQINVKSASSLEPSPHTKLPSNFVSSFDEPSFRMQILISNTPCRSYTRKMC